MSTDTTTTRVRCAWCGRSIFRVNARKAQTGEIVCVSPAHCKTRARKASR